ncbi:J domain-containing protein [Novosphingobium terrae]|uniref:molecular chaperone DnaJ n=1 Tax=Novosphingobium terrae TaxID=2726189 RepID=UPI0019824237|nr:molecular chaperone DnaJ [Novosphingobium terrae]
MMKLISLAFVLVLLCKFVLGRYPWEIWRIVPIDKVGRDSREKREQRALRQARNLLGIHAYATRSEIIEAHKRLLTKVHPDRGGNEALVHEANAARDTLLEALVLRDRRFG